MIAPALLYLLVIPRDLVEGWGVPMSTDTAFAVALIVMLGSRVPIECALSHGGAIVDDLGAIVVVAVSIRAS